MKVETTAAVSDPPSAVSAAVTGELAALVAFCQAHGSPCFVGWPPEILARWLCFHAEHGSLAVVKTPDGAVVGMSVGWQCRVAELERRWHVTDPEGDCFYFAHLIVTHRPAMALMTQEWPRRIPNWPSLKLFARRRRIASVFKRGLPPGTPDGVCQYPHRLLKRLYARAL
jgi:hypothetical protein